MGCPFWFKRGLSFTGRAFLHLFRQTRPEDVFITPVIRIIDVADDHASFIRGVNEIPISKVDASMRHRSDGIVGFREEHEVSLSKVFLG